MSTQSEKSSNTFFDALSQKIDPRYVAHKGGLAYISAARSMLMAGRPQVRFAEFDGAPCLALFNGAVIAVDLAVADGSGLQRTWLPVMDEHNDVIPYDRVSAFDVYAAQQRCMVKAIAMTLGVGMSIYMGLDGDGERAVKQLAVTPDADLVTARALVGRLDESKVPYVGWPAANAAARVVHPNLIWSLVLSEGRPYVLANGGVLVGMDLKVDGASNRFWLPVMDGGQRQIPAASVTAADWNKSVMRLLAKAIAYSTGYGLEVYAEDFGNILEKERAVPASSEKPKAEAAQAQPQASDASKAPEPTAAPAAAPVATPEQGAQAPAANPAPDGHVDARKRFHAVIAKRFEGGGMGPVVGLFDALAKSTKYTAEEKPECLRELMSYITAMIHPDQDFDAVQLLEEIVNHKAALLFEQEARSTMGTTLGGVCLVKTAKDDKKNGQVGNLLVQAHLVETAEAVLALARTAGLTEAEVILLGDSVCPF